MQAIENVKYHPAESVTGKMTTRKIKMKRKTVYWLCQIIGWGTFLLLNLIIISSFKELHWERIVTGIFFVITGISFTHIFRGIIKKRNWLKLPLKKIIPNVIISSFILGIVIYGLTYGVSFFSGMMDRENYTAIKPVLGIINTTGLALFWALIYFSIHYLENYKKTEIESLIWEAAVKDYELKTLKSQLNPHFMFNAMNSIRALIEEDPESAKVALTKLSNILRYSLKMERAERVPLWQEIETVKDYLDLEKIRFEERLRYSLNIDNEAARVEIPPMMIQTLVENGIKHGISKITEGGKIEVDSRIENSNLFIEIRNNGQIANDALKNARGFGVSNTKHRLNLLFGETASFTLINESEDKVLAKLIIPTGG
ncbi:sensor histidine kinase YehU [bacterium BMS3Abin03]|nr:sensor histidine kinase YehU [bacterium BMS3Abin03]